MKRVGENHNSSGVVEYGLSFTVARERVRDAFRKSLLDLQQLPDSFDNDEIVLGGNDSVPAQSATRLAKDNDYKTFFHYLAVIPLVTIVLYAISLYSIGATLTKYFNAGITTSIVVLVLSSFMNYAVVHLYQRSERNEVIRELSEILADYEAAHEAQDSFNRTDTEQPKSLNEMLISSGHSQVSIINTYRLWFTTFAY